MKRLFSFLILALVWSLSFAAQPSGTLPILYITTENNAAITSKEVYLNATYYLDAKGFTDMTNIGSAAAPLNMQIKGRGNYTWKGFDKKPYRIKLADKQALCGLNKSKHFALLAHADDKRGFMRNAVGFELSKMIGLPWTPETHPIELVLNGEYIGLYFLTETIRVDKDRVNIVEQTDNETDANAITGGWLIEIDNYDEDPHITIKEGGKHTMWFTYNTPEELSTQQEAFLTEEMKRLDNLIYGDKNSDELWQYLDIDALAKFYIVQEITDNYESFHGSCYLYREQGENQKWKFGPVWDFGSAFYRDKTQYLYQGDVWHNHWIPELCKFPKFMEYVKTLWNEFYKNQFSDIYTFTAAQLELLKTAAVNDAARWPDYGNKDMSSKISDVNARLQKSSKWLNDQWKSANNGGNTGNEDNNDTNIENELQTMYVWVNGQATEFSVLAVDSITFQQKEAIVVKAQVPSTWSDDIYVWVWGSGLEGSDIKAKKQGDWFVYIHNNTKEFKIIFKEGQGWKGHPYQTENITVKGSMCLQVNKPVGEEKATVTQIDCD